MKAHVLATKIGGILNDNKYDRFVGNKTRGKIDFAGLAKIGYSSKVFKKREARKNKDYKLIILADASGSMYTNNRHFETGKALEMLNEALSKTDVKYAIWSFSGDVISLKDFNEKKSAKDCLSGLYLEHIDSRVLKYCENCNVAFGAYGRGYTACVSCGKATSDETGSSSYNADGLALHLAMESMKELSGEHIILVLSDGQADILPTHKFHGKDSGNLSYMVKGGVKYIDMKVSAVAKKAVKDGIILCSIGIQSDDVLRHYPKENTIVVKNSNEIGYALTKLISKQIKRG